MSHTVKLFEQIVNHMLRTIVQLGNIHFVFRRGQSIMDPVVDRPLLNTKWVLLACGLLSAQIASRCGTLALFFKSCFTPV